MRAVQGSTVLTQRRRSAAALVEAMAETDGIAYMRTTRGAYPVIYDGRRQFPAGGAKVLRSTPGLRHADRRRRHACTTAYRRRRSARADGIHARVIDLYSVKPVDVGTLVAALRPPAAASS